MLSELGFKYILWSLYLYISWLYFILCCEISIKNWEMHALHMKTKLIPITYLQESYQKLTKYGCYQNCQFFQLKLWIKLSSAVMMQNRKRNK